jgi:hypothetical protein
MPGQKIPSSIPGFQRTVWTDPRRPGVGGKILSPGQGDPVVTHTHTWPGGGGISTQRPGQKPERFTWGR